MKNYSGLFLVLSLIFSIASKAAEFPAQGRIFLGSTTVDLSQINNSLSSDGMSTFTSSGRYGLEITYPWKMLNLGMRYHMTNQVVYENPDSTATNYQAELMQSEILLLARTAVYKQGQLYVDIFAGVGGTNTTYKVRTATQNGELTKNGPSDWFASPAGAAGVSVGLGINNIYGYIEAGYEYNKVGTLTSSGTVNSSIQEINLSGNYILFGLMFDGIKATSK